MGKMEKWGSMSFYGLLCVAYYLIVPYRCSIVTKYNHISLNIFSLEVVRCCADCGFEERICCQKGLGLAYHKRRSPRDST